MKTLINIVRYFVGLLFIFSGLVKANDPLGLSYKMQEFFEVWGIHFLDNYTLFFSVAIIAFEIVAGVAVIVAWQMNLVSWLLLLLILYFTFLTGYAVLSGKIRECGCFGDCIPLTADQSFVKDIILTLLILVIFANRKKIQGKLSTGTSVFSLLLSAVFSFAFMWYALSFLPPVDCLPYKKGSSILEKMKIPVGAIPDSTVITFVYEKSGTEIEFTADRFPDDFNDSAYTFIRRYDKLIRAGNAVPPIKDFSLTSSDGVTVTDDVLRSSGYKLLLFLRADYVKNDWLELAELATREAQNKGIALYLVSSIPLEELNKDLPKALSRFTQLTCDVTAIKTAARANPTIYLLQNDKIAGKWSYQDIDKVIEAIVKIDQ